MDKAAPDIYIRAALLQACKAMCNKCREPDKYGVDFSGLWHIDLADGVMLDCDARPIRELLTGDPYDGVRIEDIIREVEAKS